ncbi:SDR family NAD(P)-dependent oxidoreductase [Kitasatospora herbaricolor]|uniref:SDR family NAD(P)-dependent oxidoreductase n=1 Tax=Kitasatospora herbaricolor TaxID=68217 RepID=UPI0036DA9C18
MVLVGRRVDRLNELTSQLPTGRTIPLLCDLTVERQRDSVIDTTVEKFGQVEIVVNSAGVASFSPATDETEDELEHLLHVSSVSRVHDAGSNQYRLSPDADCGEHKAGPILAVPWNCPFSLRT